MIVESVDPFGRGELGRFAAFPGIASIDDLGRVMLRDSDTQRVHFLSCSHRGFNEFYNGKLGTRSQILDSLGSPPRLRGSGYAMD